MIYNEELYEVNLYPGLAGFADAPGTLSTASDTLSGGVAINVLSPGSQNASYEVPNASEYVFVGSIKSDKYHYPSCRAAQKIKPENEIWFTSSADARTHGYAPCGICNPP